MCVNRLCKYICKTLCMVRTTLIIELAGCGTKEQNWLCLQCGAVNCGRYVNGHAKQHAEEALHQLCMSCDVYSVYW